MTINNDNFGAGILDDSANSDSASDSADDSRNADIQDSDVVLSDESIAIAEGNGPTGFATMDDDGDDLGSDDDLGHEDNGEVDEDSDDYEDEPGDLSSDQADSSEQTWTESDKRLAAKYDLTDEDLEGFGTPAALHRAIDVLDRIGSKGKSTDDTSGSTDTSDAAVDHASTSGGDAKSGDDDKDIGQLGFKKLDLSKYETDQNDPDAVPLDEDSLELVKHIRQLEDFVEKTLAPVQQFVEAQQQTEHQRNSEVFHDVLDAIPDLYGSSTKDGKPVKLSDEQAAAREAVRESAETLYAGLVAKGGKVPDLKELVNMAVRAAHGDKLVEASKKRTTSDRQSRLRSQSSLRRSPGRKAGSTKRPPKQDRYSPDAIASDPEITEFFQNAQAENGA